MSSRFSQLPRQRRAHRGVSLIEALVALAVMGFGILGVVGMQASLRFNSDVSKQRSEAVRIAQRIVENRRSFSVLDTTPGREAYADIATRGAVNESGTNASYSVTETVTDVDGGKSKVLLVLVSWTDRTGGSQSVQLGTTITRVLPEFAASLGSPAFGSPTRLPDGRHPAVPRSAVDQGNGTSRFTPPGVSTVGWMFNNTTGYITSICNATICTAANARLLTGFVVFATDSSQPTPAMAETPPSTAFPVDVSVAQTAPTSGTVSCYRSVDTSAVEYFCAVPVDDLSGAKWSGRSQITGLALAATIADPTASSYRICRYTSVRGSHPTVPTISNEEHPLDYVNVTSPLTLQNFLVIRAGDGSTAFDCPADDSGTTYVNGNTWHHQPSA